MENSLIKTLIFFLRLMKYVPLVPKRENLNFIVELVEKNSNVPSKSLTLKETDLLNNVNHDLMTKSLKLLAKYKQVFPHVRKL